MLAVMREYWANFARTGIPSANGEPQWKPHDTTDRPVLILDATSASQIEEALAPVIDIGWAETRPVVDFAELMDRVTDDS